MKNVYNIRAEIERRHPKAYCSIMMGDDGYFKVLYLGNCMIVDLKDKICLCLASILSGNFTDTDSLLENIDRWIERVDMIEKFLEEIKEYVNSSDGLLEFKIDYPEYSISMKEGENEIFRFWLSEKIKINPDLKKCLEELKLKILKIIVEKI